MRIPCAAYSRAVSVVRADHAVLGGVVGGAAEGGAIDDGAAAPGACVVSSCFIAARSRAVDGVDFLELVEGRRWAGSGFRPCCRPSSHRSCPSRAPNTVRRGEARRGVTRPGVTRWPEVSDIPSAIQPMATPGRIGRTARSSCGVAVFSGSGYPGRGTGPARPRRSGRSQLPGHGLPSWRADARPCRATRSAQPPAGTRRTSTAGSDNARPCS